MSSQHKPGMPGMIPCIPSKSRATSFQQNKLWNVISKVSYQNLTAKLISSCPWYLSRHCSCKPKHSLSSLLERGNLQEKEQDPSEKHPRGLSSQISPWNSGKHLGMKTRMEHSHSLFGKIISLFPMQGHTPHPTGEGEQPQLPQNFLSSLQTKGS